MDDMEGEWWMIWRGSGGCYEGGMVDEGEVVDDMKGEWWMIWRESGGWRGSGG